MVLVPFPVLWLMKKNVEYRLTHVQKIGRQVLWTVFDALHGLIESAMVLVTFFITGILLCSIVYSWFGNYDFQNESDLVIRQFHNHGVMKGLYCLILVFILSVMFSIKKRALLFRGIILGMLILFGILAGVVEANCYTDLNFTEKTIEVHDFKQKKKYGFEEIVSYQMHKDDEREYESVTFKMSDGSRHQLFKGNYSNTDTYSKNFEKDADFLMELEKELNKMGIQGKK